jgi:hypothetical protein
VARRWWPLRARFSGPLAGACGARPSAPGRPRRRARGSPASALGTQIGFAIGGFAPTVAAGLAGGQLSGWVPVAIFTGVLCVISALAAASAEETFRTPMAELGRRRTADRSVPAT